MDEHRTACSQRLCDRSTLLASRGARAADGITAASGLKGAIAEAKKWKPDAALTAVASTDAKQDGTSTHWTYSFASKSTRTCFRVVVLAAGTTLPTDLGVAPGARDRPAPGTPAGQPGAILEVHVRGRRPVSFTERFAEVVENERVRMDYIGGDFVGEGPWTVELVDGRTRLRFRWHVHPNRWKTRLGSHFVDVGAIHSAVMQRGFEGLRLHLLTHQQAPSSTPTNSRSG